MYISTSLQGGDGTVCVCVCVSVCVCVCVCLYVSALLFIHKCVLYVCICISQEGTLPLSLTHSFSLVQNWGSDL